MHLMSLVLPWCVLLGAGANDGATVHSPTLPSAPFIAPPRTTGPAPRPLDSMPPFLKPFVKYGVGGVVALWFAGGLGWLCAKRLRRARTDPERRAARRWVAGLFVGILLTLPLIGLGIYLNARRGEVPGGAFLGLAALWLAAPLAVFLPLALAAWWGRPPRA